MRPVPPAAIDAIAAPPAGAPARRQPSPFAAVFRQALNTPPFSPWPLAPAEAAPVPTPVRQTTETVQPMERNRPRHGRQRSRG